jgi:hypothetical protein
MLSRAAVRTALVVLVLAAGGTVGLPAQEPEESPSAKRPALAHQAKPATLATPPAKAATPMAYAPAPPPARSPRQLANVRVDVKITDVRGGQTVATKTVSMTISDQESGIARSQVEAPYGKTEVSRTAFLKTDARPEIVDGQKVRLRLSLEYNLIDAVDAAKPPVTTVQESLVVLLESGKTVTVAESAEPGSDRRVRLEVTATILR